MGASRFTPESCLRAARSKGGNQNQICVELSWVEMRHFFLVFQFLFLIVSEKIDISTQSRFAQLKWILTLRKYLVHYRTWTLSESERDGKNKERKREIEKIGTKINVFNLKKINFPADSYRGVSTGCVLVWRSYWLSYGSAASASWTRQSNQAGPDTASWIGKFSNNSSLERPRIGPLARDRKEWRAKEIYIQQRVLISR